MLTPISSVKAWHPEFSDTLKQVVWATAAMDGSGGKFGVRWGKFGDSRTTGGGIR